MTASDATQSFLSHLDRVTEHGDGYRAICPCHDDHDPSLDVDLSEEGNLLIICRTCAANGADVAKKLGLSLSALFPDSDSPNPTVVPGIGTPPTRERLGSETARYLYRDAVGNRVMDAIRSGHGEDKRCWVALPDELGGGIGGMQPPLYRLPEVIEGVRAGRWIVKVEGEKDADRLAVEFCPTTNPMGAGPGKWKGHHTDFLKGAKVAILVDNDDTGIAHGEEVARSLHDVAAIVKVILLDGLPPKGDVSDWLDQGHTFDELKEVIEAAPEWKLSASPDPDEMTLRTVQRASESQIEWDGFFDKERSGEDWIVEPVIPRDRQVVFYSKAKQGKSLLALDIAAAVATGRATLGRPKGPAERVLYVDKEMTEDDLWERLRDMGYTTEDEPLLKENLAYYQLPMLPPMDTELGGKVLLQLALNHQATLVVIDTMSRVVGGKENENDTWQDFYLHTGMLLKQHGITLVRLDHSGKDGSKGQRGGSSKYDDPDVVFELTYNDPQVTLKTRGVSRVNWVPERVNLIRETNPLRHTWKHDAYSDRERDLADLLDRLELRADFSKRKAKKSVDDKIAAGLLDPDDIAIATASSAIWSGAVRLRKSRANAGSMPRTNTVEAPRTTSRTTAEESLHNKAGTTAGTTENHSPTGMGTGSRLLGGNRFPPAPEASTPPPAPCVSSGCDLCGGSHEPAPKGGMSWECYWNRAQRSTTDRVGGLSMETALVNTADTTRGTSCNEKHLPPT